MTAGTGRHIGRYRDVPHETALSGGTYLKTERDLAPVSPFVFVETRHEGRGSEHRWRA